MAFAIQGSRQDPTLEYDVADAATGAAMRVTVLGGVLALQPQQSGFFRTSMGSDPREQIGLFLPGAPPLPPGPEPIVVAELSLAQVGVYDGNLKVTRMHGVGEVQAQLAPDPQRGGQRSVYLSFTCVGADAMVVRYRVTLYRPRP